MLTYILEYQISWDIDFETLGTIPRKWIFQARSYKAAKKSLARRKKELRMLYKRRKKYVQFIGFYRVLKADLL